MFETTCFNTRFKQTRLIACRAKVGLRDPKFFQWVADTAVTMAPQLLVCALNTLPGFMG